MRPSLTRSPAARPTPTATTPTATAPRPAPPQTLTFNAGNQITTTGYSHDAAGNLTTDPTAGTLTYNGADQMTAASTGTTGYTYASTNQNELVHQDLSADVDYIYGRTDQHGLLLIQSIVKGTGTYYLDYDPLGTPLVFTTDSGNETSSPWTTSAPSR